MLFKLGKGKLEEPRWSLLRMKRFLTDQTGWGVVMRDNEIWLTHAANDSPNAETTLVKIWFTDQKLPDNFRMIGSDGRQVVSYLGKHGLGHAYIGAPQRTQWIWPGYEQNVANILGLLHVDRLGDRWSPIPPDPSLKFDRLYFDETVGYAIVDVEPLEVRPNRPLPQTGFLKFNNLGQQEQTQIPWSHVIDFKSHEEVAPAEVSQTKKE